MRLRTGRARTMTAHHDSSPCTPQGSLRMRRGRGYSVRRAGSGRGSHGGRRLSKLSSRPGRLGDFYRIPVLSPKRGDSNGGPEWEPMLSEEEQLERAWRPEARSPRLYDRANVARRLITFNGAWVVENPVLSPPYSSRPPTKTNRLVMKDRLSEASRYAESQSLPGPRPSDKGL